MIHTEHDTLLPELSVIAVREALASATGGTNWQRNVLHALDDLELSFAAHVARAERPGGFADEARSGAPRTVHALEELEREHALIVAGIAAARHSVVWPAADGDVDAATRAVAEVLTGIDAHLDASNRLAMDIANRELGGD